MNNIIDIDVLGEKLKFQADSADENIEEAVEFFLHELEEVNEKFSGNPMGVTKLVKLLIATMNIANKYLEVENVLQEINTDLEFYIQNLELKMK